MVTILEAVSLGVYLLALACVYPRLSGDWNE